MNKSLVNHSELMDKIYSSLDEGLVKNSFNPWGLYFHGNNIPRCMISNERYTNEFLWKSRKKLFEKYLKKKSKILDCGCGNGFIMKTLIKKLNDKNMKFYGVDISNIAIKSAKENLNGQVPQNNLKISKIEKLPFKDNNFDLVYSIATIPHVENIDSSMSEIYRVLKPKGILIISVYRKNIDFFIIPSIILWFYQLLIRFLKINKSTNNKYTHSITLVRNAVNKSINKLNLKQLEIIPYSYHIDNIWGKILGKKIKILLKIMDKLQRLPLTYYKKMEYIIFQK